MGKPGGLWPGTKGQRGVKPFLRERVARGKTRALFIRGNNWW